MPSYPRTKSSTDRRAYYLHSVYYQNGGSLLYDKFDRTGTTSTDSVFLGASTPGWKHNIHVGANAGSTLEGRKYRVKARYGGFAGQRTTGSPQPLAHFESDGAQATIGVFPSPPSSVSTAADNAARTKLLGDYLSARNNFRGGNFLAEVGETIHMLRPPITEIFGHTHRFAKEVRKIRGFWRHKRRYAKELGERWLAFSFGVKPLFEDIKDANKAIRALQQSPRFDSTPISGYGSDTSVVCSTLSSGFGAMPTSIKYGSSTITKAEVKYYGRIGARPAGLSTVAESFGVDPYDALPAVWEAIPWSFLVDYFVNVQEVLDGMRYANADLKWMMKGVRNSIHYIETGGSYDEVAGWSLSGSVCGGEYLAEYKKKKLGL